MARIFKNLRPKRRSSPDLPADLEKFLPPVLANRVGVEVAQVTQGLSDSFARHGDHGGGIAMRASDRLLEDTVDHAETQHVLGGDLHAGRSFLRLGSVAPQDRGGGLR